MINTATNPSLWTKIQDGGEISGRVDCKKGSLLADGSTVYVIASRRKRGARDFWYTLRAATEQDLAKEVKEVKISARDEEHAREYMGEAKQDASGAWILIRSVRSRIVRGAGLSIETWYGLGLAIPEAEAIKINQLRSEQIKAQMAAEPYKDWV